MEISFKEASQHGPQISLTRGLLRLQGDVPGVAPSAGRTRRGGVA